MAMARVRRDGKPSGPIAKRNLGSDQPELIVIRETETYVARIDNLEEITAWLGTFRERLRQARAGERDDLAHVVARLEDQYQLRRAELS